MTDDTLRASLLALREKWTDYLRQLVNEAESQPDRGRSVYCDGKASAFKYCAAEVEALLARLPGVPEEICGVIGEPESGRRVCQLLKGHDGYHQDGSTRWLGYFPASSARSTPPAEEGLLHLRLTEFVERERSRHGNKGRGGQSVGYSPSTTISVLKELERMLRDSAASRAEPPPVAWLPIASAPKDGTMVLLWFGNSQLPRLDIGRWAERDIYAEGWRCDTHQFNAGLVTHWMPLPPAPRPAGEEP